MLLAGLWMVLNEWRAAFKPEAVEAVRRRGGFESVTELLMAVANLKGSALVFVGGLAVLFTVAWMVSSAAGGDGSSDTPTPSPSAAATTAGDNSSETRPPE